MSSKKYQIVSFPSDNSIVPLDIKREFVSGKVQFLTEDGKKVKVKFSKNNWFEGDVIDQAGKKID